MISGIADSGKWFRHWPLCPKRALQGFPGFPLFIGCKMAASKGFLYVGVEQSPPIFLYAAFLSLRLAGRNREWHELHLLKGIREVLPSGNAPL